MRDAAESSGYPCPESDWETVLAPLISSERGLWPDPLRSLPAKFTSFRVGQVSAIRQIMKGYEDGNRVMVLDAPPGSGKTLIAEAVRRLLKVRGIYVCHTKSLQDQFAGDFDCSVLMGRVNYPTLREELFNGPAWSRVTAADCTKHTTQDDKQCVWCHDISLCPYERAKSALLRSELGCINTAYFLAESNYVGRLTELPFTVIDECDTLESELMGFIGVEISERRVNEYGLGKPSRVTKEAAWAEWVEGAQTVVNGLLRSQETVDMAGNVQEIRRKNYLDRLSSDLRRLRLGLQAGAWVFTGRDGRVAFKPVRVSEFGEQFVWRHSRRWLLMSGTVISPYELMDSVGGSNLPWGFVSLPSIFDEDKRKVKVMPVADTSRRAMENDRDLILNSLVGSIGKIVARHAGERMLVHTVSYDLANDLATRMAESGKENEENSGEGRLSVFTYGQASERDRVLKSFTDEMGDRSTNRTRILFAPSMDRGIDLPDDKCRVIVIVKVPYPYLGDRQVAARLYSHGGQTWYNVQTVRTLVQMTGRGVRHENDWAVTYILDKNFTTGIWAKARNLFPKWWIEGLDWKDRL